jgi:methionine-rich copper-binding protein CopC
VKTSRLSTIVLLTLNYLAGVGVTCALAHSFPQVESPAAGQTVSSGPSQVTIKFDAPVETLFAQLEVLDVEGKNVAVGAPEVGDDGRTLSVKVAALKPGHYLVKWAVVCIDTHHTSGSYDFTLAGSAT